jgi:hypothetical protein
MVTQNDWARRKSDPEFRKRKVEANRRYRAANREKVNERRRRRNATDPEYRRKDLARRRKVRRRDGLMTYGMTVADYNARLAIQIGVCAICKKKSDRTLGVDHCHKCGKIRGLLCFNCNSGLGCFYDSGSLMSAADAYVMSACSCNHGKS